jgi:cell division protein FtsQ
MNGRVKHILRTGGMVLGGFALLAALGFVEHSSDNVPVRDVQVAMNEGEGLHFIDGTALREQVIQSAGPVVGTPMCKVDESGIEKRLRAIPCLAEADVYHTMDGVLHVEARQREPIVRVVNADGTGFYIDREGWTMPLNDNYTARVLVVTGQLIEPFADSAPMNVATGTDSIVLHSRSRAIHAMALTLVSDPLWNALFEQAVVKADGDIDLIPRVGGQVVRIGDGSRLQQRLAKLKDFYAQGIPQADWRRYSAIDLRFDDQVVCTKRTLY